MGFSFSVCEWILGKHCTGDQVITSGFLAVLWTYKSLPTQLKSLRNILLGTLFVKGKDYCQNRKASHNQLLFLEHALYRAEMKKITSSFFSTCRIKCFNFSFLDDFFLEFNVLFVVVYITVVKLIPYQYWQESSKASLGGVHIVTLTRDSWKLRGGVWLE